MAEAKSRSEIKSSQNMEKGENTRVERTWFRPPSSGCAGGQHEWQESQLDRVDLQSHGGIAQLEFNENRQNR